MGVFKKSRNSLDDMANECSDLILRYSSMLSNAIKGENDITDADNFLLFLSAVALNYILLDRIAFAKMSEEDRNNFSDLVLLHIQTNIVAGTGIDKEIISGSMDNYMNTLAPHSQRLFPDDVNDGMKGTLFWEYGKMLGEGFDFGPQIAIEAPLHAMEIGTPYMKEITEALSL